MLKIILTFVLLASTALAAQTSKHVVAVRLGLNWKPEPQFGGFYQAEVDHAYEKHGIEAEIVPGGSGTPTVQMVAAGQLDFAVVSADEVVISRARGSDVVAVFASYQTNPQAVMTHPERGFKSLREVFESDGTLSLQKGLPYAQFLLKKFKLKATLVPDQGGIAGFLNDKDFSQQCFVTSEPLAAEAKGVKVQTFLVADEGYNPYTTVLVTRASVLKATPSLVKSVVAAVREGWGAYLRDPEAANKKMAALNAAMDLDTFKKSADAQKRLIETLDTEKSQLGIMTEDRWRDLAKQLADLKVIDHPAPAKDYYRNL